MNNLYIVVAGFLFLNVVVGLWRAMRGPDPADRLVSTQLFGTAAAAIMLLLAESQSTAELRYVGLMFAALTAVTVVAFVRLTDLREAMEADWLSDEMSHGEMNKKSAKRKEE